VIAGLRLHRSLPATRSQCQDRVSPSLTTGRAPTMSLVEKVKDAASPVIGMAGPVVMQALEKATPLVDMALEKANPYIEQAKEVATPYVEVAREMTAPLLESTINKVGPLAEKVSVTYGPIVDQAMEKAGPLVEKASVVARDCVEAAVFAVDTATGGRFHDQFTSVSQLVGQALSRNGAWSALSWWMLQLPDTGRVGVSAPVRVGAQS
jgi:hypothetical protein